MRPVIMSCKSIILLFLCLILGSCGSTDPGSGSNQTDYPFSGDWQGNGTDAEGNEFTFAAKVSDLGNSKYRILILDRPDTLNEPIHVMDGVMEDNKFTYTADEGLYEGGGTLGEDMFEGYYRGPVDGNYQMWRVGQ